MKTTKRILALITALVLCLAPMALVADAADDVVRCTTCGNVDIRFIRHGTITPVSGGDVYCIYESHNGCWWYCDNCDTHGQAAHRVGFNIPHQMTYYENNGDPYMSCTLCGYRRDM